MLTVGLKGLKVDCIVGIHPHEREYEQPVFIDVDLQGEFASGSLADTVDYEQVSQIITTFIRERRFELLETLVSELAEVLFAQFESIGSLALEIRKPRAIASAEHAFVRLRRRRNEGATSGTKRVGD